MDFWFTLLPVLLLLGVMLGVALRNKNGRRLRLSTGNPTDLRAMVTIGPGHQRGVIDGVTVEIRRGTAEADLRADTGIGGLRVGPDAARASDRVWTADTSFDQQVALAGPTGIVLAALDWPTRGFLAARLARATCRDGWFLQRLTGAELTSREVLAGRVNDLVRVAAPFAVRKEVVPTLLLQTAERDRLPEVRARYLRAYFEVCSPEDRQAVAQRFSLDPEPVVAVEGARALGVDGLAYLKALVVRGQLPEERLRALEAMASHPDRPETREAFRSALRSGQVRLLLPALPMLPKGLLGEVVPLVDAATLRTDYPEVRDALAQALSGAEGTIEGVEAAILLLLPSVSVYQRTNLVKTLGRVGSTAAIRRLEELAKELMVAPALKKEVQTAIDAIRARLGDRPGALSVAEELGGGLTVVTAGGLTIPES